MTFNPKKLGGGNKGNQPLLFGQATGGGERSNARSQLVRAFGNQVIPGLKNTPGGSNVSPALYKNNVLGPFRSAFNAGDVVTNQIVATDSKYGKLSNQVGGNNLARLQIRGDGISGQNGNAMYSGNPKFVYDGSDYIRFKKLQALNRNYNDKSYGGAENSQSQHAINKIRK